MNAEQVKDAIEAALETARTSAVSVKLPPFWPEKTGLWFAQAEAQFAIKGITVDKTKFSYVVSMLDDKTAAHAMDIIETPPDNDAYGALKTRLTTAYAITDSEKANRILDMNGLGDKTPSQCLNGGQEPGFLFREVFLRQLPTEVRTQLAQTTKTGTTEVALRELATEADKYFASTGSRIASVTGPSASSPESDVHAVSSHGTGQTSRPNRGDTFSFCYFHAMFGENAKKCRAPCDFKRRSAPRSGNGQAGRKTPASQ